MRRQRRFLLVLTALAALAMLGQAVTGYDELVLYLTPLFLVAALLLSGHYVGEEAIVRGWRKDRVTGRRRREAPRWGLPLDTKLRSALERSPLHGRAPPALLARTA